MTLEERLKNTIRDIPNFPKPGIIFKDISPIMLDPLLSCETLDFLYHKYKNENIDALAGIESRGFLFGYPLAIRLNIPFVLIRKKGKLPYNKISHDYNLEYGNATIEMHTDALNIGDKVLIHDDLLATGGSAEAAGCLIEKSGAIVYGFDFLISLDFLKGKQRLIKFSNKIATLAAY